MAQGVVTGLAEVDPTTSFGRISCMPNGFVQENDRRRLEVFVEDFRRSPYATSDGGEPLAIIPSPIDKEMVQDHEGLLGAALPPLFRAYLLAWCLPNTDLYVGQLPPILPSHPFEYVERWSIEKMDLPFYRRNERLIPFTHGPADGSDLCFDIYNPDAWGDYPIVKVWRGHPYPGGSEWSDPDCERTRVFNSFSEYLDYLHEWLIYKTAAPEPRFEDWLRTRGKKGPPGYYGEPC
jgi:hypothetical protein